MIFSNYNELATSSQRKDILGFAHEGIQSVLPKMCVSHFLSTDNNFLYIGENIIPPEKRVFVIGIGKASGAMALEVEKIIGRQRIHGGVVVTNDTSSISQKVEIHNADHPLPSMRSVEGAKKIMALKRQHSISKDDVIIALVSGGGSSLVAYQEEGITLDDKKHTVDLLLRSGANVHEMTTIKKKISRVKGGKLAEHFFPTNIFTLVISDVVGDDTHVIASGPFKQDVTTCNEAISLLNKYKLLDKIPPSVRCFLEDKKEENKEKLHYEHVKHHIVAKNTTALLSIQTEAQKHGFKTIKHQHVQGEAKDVARNLCKMVARQRIVKPTLFLLGGETTVTLPSQHGKGGRNQEFVLACLEYLMKHPMPNKWTIASVATDGVDFIDESSGAIIDNDSLNSVCKKGMNVSEYLHNHDSYNLLSRINSNIYVKGVTGTNVCDIILFLVYP